MSETQDIIREQLKKIPRDIRDAIIAVDLPDKFKTISTKNALRIDQATALETETMLVMLGLEHSDDYPKNLMKEVNILQEKAEKIAEEVGRMIFLPIRTSLQNFHEAEKTSEPEKPAQQPEAQTLKVPAPPSTPTQRQKHIVPPKQTPHISTSDFKHSTQPTASDLNIPSPTPTIQPPTKDIFKEKLAKQVRFAKTETSVRKNETHHGDLYREPIEKTDMLGIQQEGPLHVVNKKKRPPQPNAEKKLDTPNKSFSISDTPATNSLSLSSQALKQEKSSRIIPKNTPTPHHDIEDKNKVPPPKIQQGQRKSIPPENKKPIIPTLTKPKPSVGDSIYPPKVARRKPQQPQNLQQANREASKLKQMLANKLNKQNAPQQIHELPKKPIVPPNLPIQKEPSAADPYKERIG